MSQTVVTSSSPPGAGRSLDAAVGFLSGSVAQLQTAFSGTSRTQLENRIVGVTSGWNGVGQITNTGTSNSGQQLSRFCNRYGTSGNAGTFTTPLNMVLPIVQPTNDLQDDAAWNNMRFIYTMCRSGLTAQANPIDAGISFVSNTASMAFVFSQSVSQTSGFGVFYDNTGALWWASRASAAGGPVPAPDLVQLTTDNGLAWHEIEFRFQAAALGSNATITIVVDGVERVVRNWGVGTLLPTAASVGAALWGFGITGGKGGQSFVDSVYFSQIRTIAAPTFEAMF